MAIPISKQGEVDFYRSFSWGGFFAGNVGMEDNLSFSSLQIKSEGKNL
jgi:hypothetical protein